MQANMSAPMQSQVPTMPQQQPPGSQQQQAQVQQQQGDPDPISRFKALLPRVRESIANLFKEAAIIVRQNAAQDSGSHQDFQRIDRERTDRFEKRLEDVFALIDQMEISLRFALCYHEKLALELHHQALDSVKNTPQSVMISPKPPEHTSPEGQSYAQYLTTMRMQISFAKDLHDILTDASTKLLDKSLPPPPAPAVSTAGPSMPGGSQLSQQQHTPLSQQQHTPSSQD